VGRACRTLHGHEPKRVHPVGWSGQRLCPRRAPAPRVCARVGKAGAGHLLRHAAPGPQPRRPRRSLGAPRIRTGQHDDRCGRYAAPARSAARTERVDEPWRSCRGFAAFVCPAGGHAIVGGSHGQPCGRDLWGAISPRGGAHAPGQGSAAQLRAGYLRLSSRLDRGEPDRRSGELDPRAGRRCACHLWAQRRRGFGCRRNPRPARGGRSAHLRVRRSRPPAAGRAETGRRNVPAAHGHAVDLGECSRGVPGGPGGRHRSRGKTEAHRVALRARVRGCRSQGRSHRR